MNNKEFTTELSERMGISEKDMPRIIESMMSEMLKQLQDGNTVTIQKFGTFEVKKKAERVSVNPTTKLRMLVPPKLVLAFKPHVLLKEKFK